MSAADGTASRIIRLEQMIAQLYNQKAALEAEFKAYRDESGSYLDDSIRLTAEVVRLADELTASQNAGAAFQQIAVAAQDKDEYISALQKEINTVTTKLADITAELALANADNAKLSNAVQVGGADVREQLAIAQAQIARQTRAIAESREQLTALNAQTEADEDKIIDLTNEMLAFKATASRVERENALFLQQSVKQSAEIAALQKRLEAANVNHRESAKTLAEKTQLTNTVDELTMQNARANAELQLKNDKISTTSAEYAELREQYEAQVARNAQLSAENETMKSDCVALAASKEASDRRMTAFMQQFSAIQANLNK